MDKIRYVELREDLYNFVIKKECLDVKNPILDLTGENVRTTIRQQLCWQLKTRGELGKHTPSSVYVKRIGYVVDYRKEMSGRVHIDSEGISRFNRFLMQYKSELGEQFVQLSTTIPFNPELLRDYARFLEQYQKQGKLEHITLKLRYLYEYAEIAHKLRRFSSKQEAYEHFIKLYSSDTVEERDNMMRNVSRIRNIRQKSRV
jgi:hypothetical protein